MMDATQVALDDLHISEVTAGAPEASGSLTSADPNNDVEPKQESKSSRSRVLLDLPTELLNQIIEICEHEPRFEGPTTMDHYATNTETPTLKTLRLVSKAVANLVNPYLFHTLTLYQQAGYWRNLANIANTPSLAICVKHIRLAHIGYVKQITEFDLWELMTGDSRGARGDLVEHPPVGGPLANWDFEAEAGWERYQRWRDEELVMRKHDEDGTAPKVALDLFTNLQSAETVGIVPLWTIQRKPWMRWHGIWYGRPETRRYFETGLFDEHTMAGVPLGACPYIPSTHLQTMMVALQTCGKNLTKLTLHRVQEIYYIREPGLPSLKHLVVDTRFVRYQDWFAVKDVKASNWINDLENLESLEVIQNPGGENNPDMCQALVNAEWPKLHRLELFHVEPENANLLNFVAKHIEKLESMKVYKPLMKLDSWEEFQHEVEHWREVQHWREVHPGKRLHTEQAHRHLDEPASDEAEPDEDEPEEDEPEEDEPEEDVPEEDELEGDETEGNDSEEPALEEADDEEPGTEGWSNLNAPVVW